MNAMENLTCEQRRAVEYGIDPPPTDSVAKHGTEPAGCTSFKHRHGEPGRRARTYTDEYGTERSEGDFS